MNIWLRYKSGKKSTVASVNRADIGRMPSVTYARKLKCSLFGEYYVTGAAGSVLAVHFLHMFQN